MADDIAQWLKGLGLDQYATAFESNDIEIDLLPELSDADLKEIGVASLGHRRRIMVAITGLNARSSAAEAAAPPSPPTDAERRQLTVMFCDLVGSTALSGTLDPEDYRSVMQSYQEAVSSAVARYDGHVAKYLGDGVLAYFGWPRAHEDDAERAVRAGLSVIEAIAELTPRDDLTLQTRVGIATGGVVVGDIVGDRVNEAGAVSGETPNLAARLQELAAPGSVVVAESTRRLLAGVFTCVDLGPHALKGITEPVGIWSIAGESTSESRFDAARDGRLTPFIGRDHEIALLLYRWERAKEGEGQVVLLSGEAGIGKSRITEALREHVAAEPHIRMRFQCSPHYISSALHPFIAQLERTSGFAADDAPPAKLDKLEALLAQSTDDVPGVAPLFASLLSLPFDDRYAPIEMTAQRQKDRTLEALVDQLIGLARRRPVLMTFEDVHWADPTTLEALAQTLDRIQDAHVLAVITCRPEFVSPWHGYTHLTTLTLNRLTRSQCGDMVARVTDRKPLPAEVLDQIVAKTDGIPLFVEELTKTVIESGLLEDAGDRYVLKGPLPPLAIPATLQDSLMARLDRLASVKEIAQIGAAIGREFRHGLLAAVTDRSDDSLRTAIDRLVDAELIFRRGGGDDAIYIFKHGLVQDAAYKSLLKSSRQVLHQRIAAALQQHFPDVADAEPEILAHHYTEAGLIEPAIEKWRRAGERAAQRSASYEAVMQLERALALLATLPSDRARDGRELDMRLMLGASQLMARGHGASEVEQAYGRALELSERADDADQVVRALFGLWRYHIVVPNLPTSMELARRLQEQGRETGEAVPALLGNYTAGFTKIMLGNPLEGSSTLEAALQAYDESQRKSLAYRQGQDPAEACGVYRGMALWLLGFPNAACVSCDKGLAHANQIGDPFSQAHGHAFQALLHQMMRDREGTQRHTAECARLAEEFGFALWRAWSEFFTGWLHCTAHPGANAAPVAQALGAFDRLGIGFSRPFTAAMLTEAWAAGGNWDAALLVLDEIQTLLQTTNERWWEPEVHRLRGEYLLARDGNAHAAKECFQRALAVARRQQAKSLELRAAMSLARVWRHDNQLAMARDLLVSIYNWFTEGLETPDLQEAKALVEELS